MLPDVSNFALDLNRSGKNMTKNEFEQQIKLIQKQAYDQWLLEEALRTGQDPPDYVFDQESTSDLSSAPLQDDHILTVKDLLREYVPFNRSTLWRKIEDGRFPKPLRLAGSRRIGWRWSTIQKWINEQR